MSASQDQTQGWPRFERLASRKRKRLSRKPTVAPRDRVRVNIGLAFEKWRAVKTTHGLKSDAEVALWLLDV